MLFNGAWVRATDLFSVLPVTAYKPCKVWRRSRQGRKGRPRTFWIIQMRLTVRSLGEMTVVLSKKSQWATTGVVFVTNDQTLPVSSIVRCYNQRWSIEEFFRDARQHLHLNSPEYQNLTANIRHYYLVFWAYSILVYLRCTGIVRRRYNQESRTVPALKQVFQKIALETFVERMVTRAASEGVVKVCVQVLREQLSWSFQTLL